MDKVANKHKASSTGAGESFVEVVVHESMIARGTLCEGSDIVVKLDESPRVPNRNALIEIRCDKYTFIGRCGERKNGGYLVRIQGRVENDYQR